MKTSKKKSFSLLFAYMESQENKQNMVFFIMVKKKTIIENIG